MLSSTHDSPNRMQHEDGSGHLRQDIELDIAGIVFTTRFTYDSDTD